ncbi:hypothetical protein [Methanoregula sp.]|jgi:hypothetical protein|uniref:hypothetical protein n=1 Tax=Methanoregula sp. TaxID=2052170 RepID=UPI003C196DD4
MQKRIILTLLVICIGMLFAAGCTSAGAGTSPAASSAVKPSVPSASATPAVTIAGGGYHLTGQGIQNTGEFHLDKGTATFTFRITQPSRNPVFEANLYDSKGNWCATIANAPTGSATPITRKQIISYASDYYINVNTQDIWDITITP